MDKLVIAFKIEKQTEYCFEPKRNEKNFMDKLVIFQVWFFGWLPAL